MPGTYISPAETGFYYLQSRYYDPTTCRFINADVYYDTGQGFNGLNMFAYCNNNPVMLSDSSGTYTTYSGYTSTGEFFTGVPTHQLGWYGQLTDYWIDGDIAPEINYGFTYSTGLGVSGNLGFLAFTGQGGVSVDAKGNVGVQFSLSYSFNASVTGSDYGASFGSYNMITNARNIYKLEKESYQLGISGTTPIPNTNMNGFVESNFLMMPTIDPNKSYIGYSDFAGISTYGSSDFNFHFTGGYTFDTVWDFNIYKLFGG